MNQMASTNSPTMANYSNNAQADHWGKKILGNEWNNGN